MHGRPIWPWIYSGLIGHLSDLFRPNSFLGDPWVNSDSAINQPVSSCKLQHSFKKISISCNFFLIFDNRDEIVHDRILFINDIRECIDIDKLTAKDKEYLCIEHHYITDGITSFVPDHLRYTIVSNASASVSMSSQHLCMFVRQKVSSLMENSFNLKWFLFVALIYWLISSTLAMWFMHHHIFPS